MQYISEFGFKPSLPELAAYGVYRKFSDTALYDKYGKNNKL